ncbi:MAG TPA: hypothetical protein VOA41_03725 [Candidatus Dormibacteraeota bacterium]|nr:hypothetical protein [Candidatus Dormibacteraeota bacterium]
MKRLGVFVLSLILISGTALADAPKNSDRQPVGAATPAKPKTAAKAGKTNASLQEELEALRQMLQSQQEQLQALKEELAKRDRRTNDEPKEPVVTSIQPMEPTARAAEAVETIAHAEVTTMPASRHSTSSNLKLRNDNTKSAEADSSGAQQNPKAQTDEPIAIRYKGISITPGAFLAAETVFRNHSAVADVNTPFNAIPFPGNSQSKVSEFNASGRASRWSLLAEGKGQSYKYTGYYEADFLSAATTSNNNQSNSYTFRQRQAFGQLALNSGWSFTGGQMWSLVTETKKGLQNRTEASPLTVDHQYNVGFSWARQFGFRVVRSFDNDKVALGFSIEGPQTTFGGRGFSSFTNANGAVSQNFFIGAPGVAGGLYNPLSNYSFNKTPDFVIKAVADPGWGHYELFGIISTYRSRIYPCAVVSSVLPCPVNGSTTPSTVGAFNDSRTSGGVGINIRVPVVAKNVDAGLHFLGGDGIGRYGTAGLPDATARPDGSLALIRGGQALATLEFHPIPNIDLYANFGTEYTHRAAYTGYARVVQAAGGPTTTTTNGIGGYGSPFANNSGCSTEITPTSQNTPGTGGPCAGDTKNISEATIGFWHRFYQGPSGRLQWGIQYSYVTKTAWSGNNNVPTAAGSSPKAVTNMLFTSFRYYIP